MHNREEVIQDAYAVGFLTKCAELGVQPAVPASQSLGLPPKYHYAIADALANAAKGGIVGSAVGGINGGLNGNFLGGAGTGAGIGAAIGLGSTLGSTLGAIGTDYLRKNTDLPDKWTQLGPLLGAIAGGYGGYKTVT